MLYEIKKNNYRLFPLISYRDLKNLKPGLDAQYYRYIRRRGQISRAFVRL